MSEEDPPVPGDQPAPAVNLRDAAVAPARQSIAEILERPAGGARRLHHEGPPRAKPSTSGKAAVLRNRVRQYFQASSGDNRDFVPHARWHRRRPSRR